MNIKTHMPMSMKVIARRHLNSLANAHASFCLSRVKPSATGTIYYLGITSHTNLGDLAQFYCIGKWLKENYPSHRIIEFNSDAVVDTRFGFVEKLKNKLQRDDMIVFQSGYTTQDLGGYHDLMHRLIIDNMPDANILMMPQTIYFQNAENRIRTAKSYNTAKHMLFLARDRVSYESACEMFPDVCTKLYPDIVTTLIGQYQLCEKEREKIYFCCRNDGEKYYTDEQIKTLREQVGQLLPTDLGDTTCTTHLRIIRRELNRFIENEIKKFSHYRLTITDRYHGTIFSLAANTPVIILKTTDHKVTTGAEWFRGVYDGYVHVAESLDHAFELAKLVISEQPIKHLDPYFKERYYDQLKTLFSETAGDNFMI